MGCVKIDQSADIQYIHTSHIRHHVVQAGQGAVAQKSADSVSAATIYEIGEG